MKRVFCLLCLPMLLWFLPSCFGEYSKEEFLPHRDAFATVAAFVQTLYETAEDENLSRNAEGERQLVFCFDRAGTTLFNQLSDATVEVPVNLRGALQTVRTFSVGELRVTPDGVYFWAEGYNNGIVYTTHRHTVRKKVAHRLYRLAKNWYCIGEHYI